MPTLTQEDYLRAIYRLQEDSDQPIKSTELTDKLSLTKSTVSQRLKELQNHGWVEHNAYGPITLTAEGIRIAQNLTYKHRIIEIYLVKELGLDPLSVHDEAHKLEHAVSDVVITQMAHKLGNPTHCPHGKKLPDFKPDSPEIL